MNSVDNRIAYIDAIRATAILLVVLLHTAAGPVKELSPSSTGWGAANLYDSFARVCVPLFIMASGALLLEPRRDETIPAFLRKRLSKILLPFLVWALFYMAVEVLFHQARYSAHDILRQFYVGPIHYHLWFIYVITALYIATPILRVFVAHASKENLLYFCVVWFLLSSLVPLVDRAVDARLRLPNYVAIDYVGYFVLGYYLRTIEAKKKRLPFDLLIVWVCTLFTATATYLLSVQEGKFVDLFYGYLRPNVVIASIFSYLIFVDALSSRAKSGNSLAGSLTAWLSAASFGIYLVHPFVLALLVEGRLGFELSGTTFHPALAVPLTALVTVVASLAIVLLLRKIPYLRRIVP